MIVVRIKGGLGNQLFQYAIGYALAKKTGQELRFNPSFTSNMTPRGYKLPSFKTEYSDVVEDRELPRSVRIRKEKYVNKLFRMVGSGEAYKAGNGVYFLEKNEDYHTDLFRFKAENIYVDGYFQSEKYFGEYRDELLEQIRPVYEAEEEYKEALDEIRGCNSVAIHVRRGDFKKDNSPYHYVLGDGYYRKALKLINKEVNDPVFFWFSDDIRWVKQSFGNEGNFRFVSLQTAHPDIDEMMLMKNCNHIITANSTFSWWAAWLNENDEAVRIVPAKAYGNKDMIPGRWIKLKDNIKKNLTGGGTTQYEVVILLITEATPIHKQNRWKAVAA